MSLLENIVGAVSKSASSGAGGFDLSALAGLASQTGASQSTLTSALSLVGSYLAKSLKDKKAEGEDPEALMEKFSGSEPSESAVNSIFSNDQKAELSGKLEEKGILSGNVGQVLAALVPIGLQVLKSMNQEGSGSDMLKGFLDADGDGDLDLSDAMSIASKFMK